MSCENLLYDDSIMMGHKPTDNEKNACCIASLQICKHRFVGFVVKINLAMNEELKKSFFYGDAVCVFRGEISMNFKMRYLWVVNEHKMQGIRVGGQTFTLLMYDKINLFKKKSFTAISIARMDDSI